MGKYLKYYIFDKMYYKLIVILTGYAFMSVLRYDPVSKDRCNRIDLIIYIKSIFNIYNKLYAYGVVKGIF